MKADVVVVGAGALGLSTALHCASRGLHVVLVERDTVGSQASGRAAALFKSMQSDRLRTQLSARSIEKILTFSDWAGADLEVTLSGSYAVASNPEYKAALKAEADYARQWGAEVHEVEVSSLADALPYYRPNGSEFVVHSPRDMYLTEPGDLIDAYVAGCRAQGVEILEGETAVATIASEKGIIALETDKRRIETHNVVDAAGAWSRIVGEGMGIDVAVAPVRHQLFITEEVADVTHGDPIARVMDSAIYMRPARGGLMFGALESDPLPLDPREQSGDFRTSDVPMDIEVLRRLASGIVDEVPVASTARIVDHRAGLFTMTPDGRQLVGAVPYVPGAWVASGCNGAGFSLSPAIGENLAEAISGGQPIDGFESLSPARSSNVIDRSLTEKGVWHYAHYYELTRVDAG